MQRGNVLIVDEEEAIRSSLEQFLREGGYKVTSVGDGRQALEALGEGSYDVVLLDLKLPGTSWGEVLHQIHSREPELPVIVTTSQADGESAATAMKEGASDHVAKPFSNEDIACRVKHVLETARLRKEVHHLRREQIQRFGFERIIGKSPSLQEVFQLVSRILPAGEGTILIQGERGTGKEVLAKAIHYAGLRTAGPYASVKCKAVSDAVLESELFGHEEGAFPQAESQRKGLLELSSGGTIFLDEIAHMSLGLQAKLVRFLEEKAFRRAGGSRDIHVDITVIAATSQDLKPLVEKGQFREDLHSRLQGAAIRLPPLRERPGDIPSLVDHFIGELNRELKKDVKGATPALMKRLEEYAWPGNVRELENTIERAMILATGEHLSAEDIPVEIRDGASSKPTDGRILQLTSDGINLEMLEKDLVCQALQLTSGNQTRAGRLLGLNRDQIRYRIEKFNLRAKESTPAN